MNATFDSMMNAMGWHRVEQDKPCSTCQYSLPTNAYPLISCVPWDRTYQQPSETCVRWVAK